MLLKGELPLFFDGWCSAILGARLHNAADHRRMNNCKKGGYGVPGYEVLQPVKYSFVTLACEMFYPSLVSDRNTLFVFRPKPIRFGLGFVPMNKDFGILRKGFVNFAFLNFKIIGRNFGRIIGNLARNPATGLPAKFHCRRTKIKLKCYNPTKKWILYQTFYYSFKRFRF